MNNHLTFENQRSQDAAIYTILDNDFFCFCQRLSFLRESIVGDIGIQFYNIFVQSVKTPAVRSKLRNQIPVCLSDPNPQIKAGKKAKKSKISLHRDGTLKNLISSRKNLF